MRDEGRGGGEAWLREAVRRVSRLIPMADLSPVPVEAASYAMEADDGAIYIPVIGVKNPGHGEGGRFLDSLPTDKTIKVPSVLNPILAGMLLRRGYVVTFEWFERADEEIEVYVREASKL